MHTYTFRLQSTQCFINEAPDVFPQQLTRCSLIACSFQNQNFKHKCFASNGQMQLLDHLENVQIKIILDVSLLRGALGLLDEGLMNSFLWMLHFSLVLPGARSWPLHIPTHFASTGHRWWFENVFLSIQWKSMGPMLFGHQPSSKYHLLCSTEKSNAYRIGHEDVQMMTEFSLLGFRFAWRSLSERETLIVTHS